jgi:lipoprotein-releasing system permease protein
VAAAYTQFLGLRYSFSPQRSRFTALVSLASMLGMTLGVASLITVLSVMNGFAGELRSRILALVPHAYVEGVDPAEQQALAAELVAHPDVAAVAPFARGKLLLSAPFRQRGAELFGLAPAEQSAVTDLENYLLSGALADLEQEFTVILGSSLARTLGVVPGDTVRAVLPRLTSTPAGVFPRSRMLRVVGLFEVGAQQDNRLAFASLDTARRLFGGAATRGLQLRSRDLMLAPRLGPELTPLLNGRGVYRPWSETQGTLFRAIRMEKITVSLLLLSVVLVAAFNIVSTLVMAVTEKRRDIAVLRTMGATPGEIATIFLVQGLSLAVFGVLLGTALGVALALNIARVVDFFERALGSRIFDPEVYFISRLPSELMAADVFAVSVAAVALSVVAALYPAWRASRIAPAEVLRYE